MKYIVFALLFSFSFFSFAKSQDDTEMAMSPNEFVFGDIKLQTDMLFNSDSSGYSVNGIYQDGRFTYSLGGSYLSSEDGDNVKLNASVGYRLYESDRWSLIVGPGISNADPFIFYSVLFPVTKRLTLDAGYQFIIDDAQDDKSVMYLGMRYDFGDRALITSLDTDGDGVEQSSDVCKSTPLGKTVNLLGCTASEIVLNETVFFDETSSSLNKEFDPTYKNIAKRMKADATLTLHIVNLSYASTGSGVTNIDRQRREVLVNALTRKYGIARDRITLDSINSLSVFSWKDSQVLLLVR